MGCVIPVGDHPDSFHLGKIIRAEQRFWLYRLGSATQQTVDYPPEHETYKHDPPQHLLAHPIRRYCRGGVGIDRKFHLLW